MTIIRKIQGSLYAKSPAIAWNDPIMEYLVDRHVAPETRGKKIRKIGEEPEFLIRLYEKGTLPIIDYGELLILAFDERIDLRDRLKPKMNDLLNISKL